MAITYTDTDTAMPSDELMLARIRNAIADILTGAQSYTIFGSRQVTRANLGELRALEQQYERRVLMARGWNGRNVVDFSLAEESEGVPE
jgi:hypothetical protein